MNRTRNIQYGKAVRTAALRPLVVCFAALSTLFPASCSKESPISDEQQETPIQFVAGLGEETQTKGLAPMTDQTLETFGVFTAYHPEGSGSAVKDWTYMQNTPYRRNSITGTFDTSPARYWPVTGNMTFLAIAPYDRHITESMDFSAVGGYPSLRWSPDSDPRKQIDLCVAVNPDQPKQTQLPLAFHHATAQLYFAANYVELEQYQFIIIDRITITNIIGEKRVSITDTPPYVEWEPDAGLARNSGYELSRTGGHLNDERLPLSTDAPRGTEISTDAGRLFLIPQSYDASSSDIELTVSYTLYYQDTDNHGPVQTVRQFTMESVMPRCEWKPDTRYRFLLTIHDITKEQDAVTIQMYEDKKAVYYPMVCSFELPSDTRTVGTEYPLEVTVGPEEVSTTNKEVDWSVGGVTIQDMYNYPDRDEVKALPVLLQYRDTDGQTVLDPETISGTGTHKVWVICKKIGTANIKARTRWAASEATHKEALQELTVTGKDGTMGEYPSDDYDWTD